MSLGTTGMGLPPVKLAQVRLCRAGVAGTAMTSVGSAQVVWLYWLVPEVGTQAPGGTVPVPPSTPWVSSQEAAIVSGKVPMPIVMVLAAVPAAPTVPPRVNEIPL